MTLTHPNLGDSTNTHLEVRIKNIEAQINSAIIKCLLALYSFVVSILSIIGGFLRMGYVSFKWELLPYSILVIIISMAIFIKSKQRLNKLKQEKKEAGDLYKSEILDQKINHSTEDELYFYRN